MVNTWKIVLAALVIFAAGVLTGGITVGVSGRIIRLNRQGAGTYYSSPTNGGPQIAGSNTNQPLKGPGAMRVNQIRAALQVMTLSPAQKDRIDALMHQSEQTLKDIWEPVAPKIQREVRNMENGVLDSLEPPQRPVFRDLLKRRPSELRNMAYSLTNTPPSTNAPATATNTPASSATNTAVPPAEQK